MKTLVHTDLNQIESVIKKCSICFVGMVDTDGTPYVIPMNFGYLNGSLYLHSAHEGRSISILNKNSKVCISFCPSTELVFQNEEVACSYRMRSSSVICWGNVVFEEEYDKKVEALHILMKQYTDRTFRFSKPSVDNVKIWRVDIDDISCKEYGAPHKAFSI